MDITRVYEGFSHDNGCGLFRTGRFEAHIWDSGKQVYLGKNLHTAYPGEAQ